MKVLVTGAAGFVGSQVVNDLLERGIEVIALDHPGSDLERISHLLPQLTVVKVDITDSEELSKTLRKHPADACIHLAWYVEHGKYWTSLHNLDMVAASLKMLPLLADAGVRRLVSAGTCVEYDVRAGYLIEDQTPYKPQSVYAASKLALFHMSEQAGQQLGLEVAWPRLFYLYGPGEPEDRLVPLAINRFLSGEPLQTTGGTQVRDYLHIYDVARALNHVALDSITGPVNIGSGVPVTLRTLLYELADQLNARHLLQIGALAERLDDPPFIVANTARLRGIGWNPTFDLSGGLKNAIDWWKARRNQSK